MGREEKQPATTNCFGRFCSWGTESTARAKQCRTGIFEENCVRSTRSPEYRMPWLPRLPSRERGRSIRVHKNSDARKSFSVEYGVRRSVRGGFKEEYVDRNRAKSLFDLTVKVDASCSDAQTAAYTTHIPSQHVGDFTAEQICDDIVNGPEIPVQP